MDTGAGFVLGGALKGVGDAWMKDIMASREEARDAIANDRLVAREEADRAFRASEGEKNRQAQRENQGQYATGAGGETYRLQGDKATPVTGPDGKPIKGLGTKSTGQDPADIKTANWLMQNGIAKNPKDAWEIVRTSRSNPEGTRAGILKKWIDALTKGALGPINDPDKIRKQAEGLTEETMKFLGGEGDAPAVPGASSLPPGSGTEEDPYRATTKEQVQWFQTNAKPGQIIIIPGKGAFRKKASTPGASAKGDRVGGS